RVTRRGLRRELASEQCLELVEANAVLGPVDRAVEAEARDTDRRPFVETERPLDERRNRKSVSLGAGRLGEERRDAARPRGRRQLERRLCEREPRQRAGRKQRGDAAQPP